MNNSKRIVFFDLLLVSMIFSVIYISLYSAFHGLQYDTQSKLLINDISSKVFVVVLIVGSILALYFNAFMVIHLIKNKNITKGQKDLWMRYIYLFSIFTIAVYYISVIRKELKNPHSLDEDEKGIEKLAGKTTKVCTSCGKELDTAAEFCYVCKNEEFK